MIPAGGSANVRINQITRTIVGSAPRYSAIPLQTPAIFFPALVRVSLRWTGDGPLLVGVPHSKQKRSRSSNSLPHLVQNITLSSSGSTRWTARMFRSVAYLAQHHGSPGAGGGRQIRGSP